MWHLLFFLGNYLCRLLFEMLHFVTKILNLHKTLEKSVSAEQKFVFISRIFQHSANRVCLTLFQLNFLASYDRGGGGGNNVTVELGQWNLAHTFSSAKPTLVPNLVVIVSSMTSPWHHHSTTKVSYMFVKRVLFCYENILSVFIWLFFMLESCSLHFHQEIAKCAIILQILGCKSHQNYQSFASFEKCWYQQKFMPNFICFIIDN